MEKGEQTELSGTLGGENNTHCPPMAADVKKGVNDSPVRKIKNRAEYQIALLTRFFSGNDCT